jgi:hypothetical protein
LTGTLGALRSWTGTNMIAKVATRFLKCLPELHLALLVPSLTIAVFSRDEFIIILAVGVGVLWGLILTFVAIICMLIMVTAGSSRSRDRRGGTAV